MITFQNKTILITGASGGIGAAAAKLFHGAGANLVLTDLDTDQVEKKAVALTQVSKAEGRIQTYALDVADASACHTVAAAASETFGGIDAVVNCAGIYVYKEGLLTDLTLEQWHRMIDINLTGCFNICKATIPHLKQGSAIVLIASVAASRGSFMHSSYAAAKNGVIGLARSLALELAPKTRTNVISPGLINTQMAGPMVADRGDAVKAAIPLQRFGEAVEAAGAIAFLCSDLASYISGVTLNVNGGMYID